MEFGQDEVRVINDDIPSSPTGGIHQRDRGDSINVVSEPDTNDEDAKHPEHLSLEIPVETKPLLPLLVPSLRGKMTYEGGMVTCKGVWGMSDIAHSQPGQTSDFEFKLVKADEGSGLFPVNGKYQGYFMLKQLAPLKGSIKVEDKEMMIKFTKSESDGRHEIQGKGINKFGSFTLRGTLYEDGNAQMYREYYNLTPTPLPSGVKRRLSVDGDDSAPKSTKKVARASTEGTVPPPPEISPRESSGRARKASSAMMEYMEMNTPKPPPTPKAPAPIPFKLEAPTPKQPKAAPATAPSSSSAGQYNTYGLGMPLIRHESTSDRAQRMPPYLKKCSELLKELSKHVQAQWFLEPVDPIKLGIPEYPSIITHPMDFSTIRKKIDEASYLAVEGFADDMRLVFRNAITFNVAKESIVNIAARDMSNRFEDRYRVMVSQLQGIQAYSAGAIMDLEIKTPRQSLGGGFGSSKKSVGASKTPRTSIGGVKLPSHTPGPRVGSSVNLAGMNYLPPAADGSAHQLAEMARMMSKMQSEMDQLRAQVRNNETITMLKDHQDAAHNPLTLDEKKTLIAQIHRLPPDSLEHVLEIIQSVMPPRDDNGDDIEIPLDALDTATLRKLQRYIETRPRPAPVQAAPVQRQMSSSAGGAPKRARKSTSSTKLGGGASSAGLSGGSSSAMTPLGVDFHGDDGDLPLLDEDDLLFTADSFEELKSNAQREGTSGASGIADSGLNNSAMMEDDDDFASLAAMHNDDAVRSDNVHLGNSNAWNQ